MAGGNENESGDDIQQKILPMENIIPGNNRTGKKRETEDTSLLENNLISY
jgi:hypothetical protein